VFWIEDFPRSTSLIVRIRPDDVNQIPARDAEQKRSAIHIHRGYLLSPFWQGVHFPAPPGQTFLKVSTQTPQYAAADFWSMAAGQ
jgi:hypothetical protein